jgi:DNA-binding NarL/FixJ family response regulator
MTMVASAATAGSRPARLLTERELSVLRLLASGCSDSDIGHVLEIAPGTVRAHVENARAKLHASSRAEAVATALRREFIR